MYEKLDKIRAELNRAKQRRLDADIKVKQLEQKLKEAENMQILADVDAMKLTPEQLAQFLQLANSGKLQEMLSGQVSMPSNVTKNETVENVIKADKDLHEEEDEIDD